ncbi:unnamed protein product [Notodromas monacha]|uniref:Calcineurin-like phosphoesterase domain-containing protein n=1 Tax=Notodromas monacha TaxID=399045 RepID=A0A7R9BZT8_9CRUS|nr:unnamed protein product [Notodromas monacha]CAG0923849.1 unnamed protein product [Notodromas monacha]
MNSVLILVALAFLAVVCINWTLMSQSTDSVAFCPATGQCNCDGADYMSPNHPWKRDRSLQLKDSPKKLLWFVQISDIHISEYYDENRIRNFESFCAETIPAIKPSVVIASGDLTDAKTKDYIGSRQSLKEWEAYQAAVKDSGVLSHTAWLDLRGNHDNFNVFDVHSPENHYRTHSVQGGTHLRSYKHTVMKDGDNYTFVALDASPSPGMKKPFNFIGMVLEKEWDVARKLEEEARCSSFSVWFAHYPTSSILAPSPGLRWLIRRSLVFLAGHFHTFGGMVPVMHAIHRPHGNLELELGDWKEGRRFRLAAIDNGLLSHATVHFGQWPIVLVTNPKDARYLLPLHEPLDLMRTSTHIRVLVFSLGEVTEVRCRIDGGAWERMSANRNEPNLKWERTVMISS